MTTVGRPGFDLGSHIGIARPDYWFKNVFVIPGIIIALGTVSNVDARSLWVHIVTGFIAICLIASRNYTLNEVLDAPSDRHHPEKKFRAIPSGRVSPAAAYVQWLLLFAVRIIASRSACRHALHTSGCQMGRFICCLIETSEEWSRHK